MNSSRHCCLSIHHVKSTVRRNPVAGRKPRAYSDTMFNAKRPIMKKVIALSLVVLLFACAAWVTLDTSDLIVTVGDQDFDGPLGALLGTLIAGSVFAVVAVVLVLTAIFVGFMLAGVGVLVMLALGLAALVTMAAVSPLLLPLLIPFGIYWWIKRRNQHKPAPAPALEHATV